MGAFGVVEAFDVLEDRKLQFLKRAIMPTVDLLFFEILEERFADGIVKGITLLGKGLDNIERIKKLTKSKGCVLRAAIRMEDETARLLSGRVGPLEGSYDKVNIRLP